MFGQHILLLQFCRKRFKFTIATAVFVYVEAGDVKAVIADITDDEFVFELKKDFAEDVVTAFIRLDGETVGVVGNQKDVMTTAGAYKAEDFVKFCDAFNIP